MILKDTHTHEKAVLAQVIHGTQKPEDAADSLGELARLADTAGIAVAAELVQRRPHPDGGTMFGEGKARELAALVAHTEANVVVFDNDLNAFQQYNLAQLLPGVKIMDRTELILLIFSRRARSAEAKIQIELAQQKLLLSRIPVVESQQRFRGAATVRGPGEAHLQLRNRPIRKRITELSRQLDEIRARADHMREHRKFPTVCLVGYTNAGKSTLLNTLAGVDDAYVDDRLFATLDTKTRMVWFSPAQRALLTDTVGFIRHLPTALVASFRSTLDVAVHADLLLLVVDASHPYLSEHIDVCRKTLAQIGADNVPTLLLLNKCDVSESASAVAQILLAEPSAVTVSACTGFGLDTLKNKMADALNGAPFREYPPALFPPNQNDEA